MMGAKARAMTARVARQDLMEGIVMRIGGGEGGYERWSKSWSGWVLNECGESEDRCREREREEE